MGYRRGTGGRKLLPKVMMAIITLAGVASGQSSPGRELLQAAEHGDVATMKRLIAAGALLDPVDQRRRTPLLNAVEKSQYEAVALLIQAGADISMRKPKIWTRPGYWPAHSDRQKCSG